MKLSNASIANDVETAAWFDKYQPRCASAWKNRSGAEIEVELGLLELEPRNPEQNAHVWVLELEQAS